MDGQLGVNGEHVLVPCMLDRFLELGSDYLSDESEAHSRMPLKVSSVKAGGMMSLAIDNLGALWMWGNCPPQSDSVSAGETYKGSDLGSTWVVHAVACGAFHTALLAVDDRASDTLRSVCWTFGLGDNGQLGHGTTKSASLPEQVIGLPQNVFLNSVDCGLFHTSVVSMAGDALSPLVISCDGPHGPKFPGPVQVACGAAHTVLVADEGYKLWSWGRGRSGVLGQKEQSKDPRRTTEMEERLSAAMEEMRLLNSKLSLTEKYASILHGSMFGKPFDERDIPISLQNSGAFDIAKEWENMLESLDRGKLVRLEMFYRNMLAGVKDKLLKRRIQEIVNESLDSSTSGNN
ncbi:hypothetical protein C3L33_15783, partial [Rhododendron williamsianum]